MTSSGVMWLSVPIWSSLPQRPQLDSALKASSTACLDTLMLRLLDFFLLSGIVSTLLFAVALRFAASCPGRAAIASDDELEFHDKK